MSIPVNSALSKHKYKTSEKPSHANQSPSKDMVWISGGTFLMGSDQHYPEEAPAHDVTVDSFWMDKYAVTNAQFRRFVDATGYVTLAERAANPDNYPGANPELLRPSSVVFRKT